MNANEEYRSVFFQGHPAGDDPLSRAQNNLDRAKRQMSIDFDRIGIERYGKKRWKTEYESIPKSEIQKIVDHLQQLYRYHQKLAKVNQLQTARIQRLTELAPQVVLTQLKGYLTHECVLGDCPPRFERLKFVLTREGIYVIIDKNEHGAWRFRANLSQWEYDAVCRRI